MSWWTNMVKLFFGLVRRAKVSLWDLWSRTLKSFTSRYTRKINFYNYDNIPLKLFLEVTETGNYLLLVREGKGSFDACFDHWENIIQENSRINGNGEYRNYYENIRQYNKLLAEYNAVTSTIWMLYFVIDNDMIAFLNRKGYKISLKSNADYVNSLNAAMNKSNNLITRIESRYKAIIKANEINGSNYKPITFEALMANLTMSLGFTVDDSLTLSRYDEYNKIIKKKHASANNHKLNHNGRV